MSDILNSLQTGASAVLNFVGAAQQSTDPKNELKLVANGKAISGWTRIRVTRGIERLPSEFDIEATESIAGATTQVSINPSNPCQIMVGNDVLMTGYVDRYMPSIDEASHKIRLVGRGKCQDLVDCSAEWGGGQIRGTNALDIANKLCSVYGIKASTPVDVSTLPPIPQFNLVYGETAGSVIERVCRYSGLLFYDDVNGDLVLSRVGASSAASGFTQGVNVQRAAAAFTIDQRFSEYDIALQSVDLWTDAGIAGNILQSSFDKNFPTPRNRKKIIVCESGKQALLLAQLRATWELNRRYGRSFSVEIVTDTWRDSDGKLWTPNTLANINIPYLKLINKDWVIGEVTFMLDQENGRTARLIMMPPDAFDVQPLFIYQQQVNEANPRIVSPGGNQNPGTPNLPPPDHSPAVSSTAKPVHITMSPGDQKNALDYLYGPQNE